MSSEYIRHRPFLRAWLWASVLSSLALLTSGCTEDDCWTVVKVFPKQGDSIGPIWGIPPEEMYLLSAQGIQRFNGNEWWQIPSSGGYGIWATSDEDIFATDLQGIIHFDGTVWTTMLEVGNAFSAIWGASNKDVFAATRWESRMYHYDGISWTEMEIPQSTASEHTIEAIWGSSGTDVYAVGYESDSTSVGRVLHYDGNSWEEVLITEENVRLNSVWGSGIGDVYVSGESDLYHFNKDEWSHIEIPGHELRSISGRSANDIVAVGYQGTIVHYDGVEWRDESISSGYDLFGVWTAPGAPIYAVGCKLFNDGNDLFCNDGVVFENTCSSDQEE